MSTKHKLKPGDKVRLRVSDEVGVVTRLPLQGSTPGPFEITERGPEVYVRWPNGPETLQTEAELILVEEPPPNPQPATANASSEQGSKEAGKQDK
jgi:hypothetical protein